MSTTKTTEKKNAKDRIEEILEPEREKAMNEKAREQFEEVKQKDHESPDGVTVGVEDELYILDENGEPLDEERRDTVIGKTSEFDDLLEEVNELEESDREALELVDHELGEYMFEIASKPVRDIGNLEEIQAAVEAPHEAVGKIIDAKGFSIGRHGTIPALNQDKANRTSETKYEVVPNKYDEMRVDTVAEEFGEIDTVNPGNENIPASICSTQLNMQAEGLEDAVEKANIGYAIAPYVTALTGNSRFHDGGDLGVDDSRVELWEKAFDIGDFDKDEVDIGKLNEYFKDIDDVRDRMLEQPRIMNDPDFEPFALDVAQGMYWKDVRVKTVGSNDEGVEINDEAVVEFRQNSIQPTIEEDIAVHAFYIGRVVYEQELVAGEYPEDLPDEGLVNENRAKAMSSGLDSELYAWDAEEEDQKYEAEEVLRDELDKARQGLEEVDIDDPGYLDILENRLETGRTPSDEAAEEYYNSILSEFGYDPGDWQVSHPDELPEDIDYDEIDEEIKREYSARATKKVSNDPARVQEI